VVKRLNTRESILCSSFFNRILFVDGFGFVHNFFFFSQGRLSQTLFATKVFVTLVTSRPSLNTTLTNASGLSVTFIAKMSRLVTIRDRLERIGTLGATIKKLWNLGFDHKWHRVLVLNLR
jgi:hypothetical protein